MAGRPLPYAIYLPYPCGVPPVGFPWTWPRREDRLAGAVCPGHADGDRGHAVCGPARGRRGFRHEQSLSCPRDAACRRGCRRFAAGGKHRRRASEPQPARLRPATGCRWPSRCTRAPARRPHPRHAAQVHGGYTGGTREDDRRRIGGPGLAPRRGSPAPGRREGDARYTGGPSQVHRRTIKGQRQPGSMGAERSATTRS